MENRENEINIVLIRSKRREDVPDDAIQTDKYKYRDSQYLISLI